jgi:predicted NBD/HSP70 family sugar kinase
LDEVLTQLLSMDLLVERPATDEEVAIRRPGPRPRYVAFNADHGRLIGVDIGADKAIVVATDLEGRILGRFRMRVPGLRREGLLSEVRKLLDEAIDLCRDQQRPVSAVVAGTPGVIEQASGVLSLAPHIPEWEGIVLQRELLGDMTCPTAVENEMHLAVLGEHWRGAALAVDDVVYIGLGVGVSAGIMVGGSLHRGFSGGAGEIGYFDFGPAEIRSAKASAGRFERSVGATAFSSMGGQASSPAEIFDAAGRGDVEATSLLEDVAATLARGVAALVLTVDPSLVVLGGGLSAAGEMLRVRVERHLCDLLPREAPKLVNSALGEEAAVLGAVYRARQLSNQAIEEELINDRTVQT